MVKLVFDIIEIIVKEIIVKENYVLLRCLSNHKWYDYTYL